MVSHSTLTLYDGRVALGVIEVHHLKGPTEYRAALPSGKSLGTFAKQVEAMAAIEAACADAGGRDGRS